MYDVELGGSGHRTGDGAEPERGPDMATFDEMREHWQEAYNRGDLEEIQAFFADDARYFAADGLIQDGPKAIAEGRQREREELMKALGSRSLKVEIKKHERHELGDTAVEIGVYTIEADGRKANEGSYMAVAKKVGGTWKITREMVTSVLPTQAQQDRLMAGTV